MIYPYVLITPARDESGTIAQTIESVLTQTHRPRAWVIVDDGSRDGTADIVQRYCGPGIRLLRRQRTSQRSFANKARAFHAGLELLSTMSYSFIGNLDADITLAPDYYEHIIAEFSKDPTLGIAGGAVYTRRGQTIVTFDETPDSIGGAVQLFRRECFEQIGGYIPLNFGGIDAAAEITARMKGWKVRKCPESVVLEQSRSDSTTMALLVRKYREGLRFYYLGYGTLFYLCRTIYRLADHPVFIGSILALLGFLYGSLTNATPSLPPDVVSYLRQEQSDKLKERLTSLRSLRATL